LKGGMSPRYSPTGHLLYSRGDAIYAAPFDPDNLEILGPSVEVATGGGANPLSGSASWALSDDGMLVKSFGGAWDFDLFRVSRLDHSGKLTAILPEARPYNSVTVSPDGKKIAMDISAANEDIWVSDISRKTVTRLTFGGGNNVAPVWSPDGEHLIYSSAESGTPNLIRSRWDGTGASEVLTNSPGAKFATSVRYDGSAILYYQGGDVWQLSLNNGRDPTPFVNSQFEEWGAKFSPDGNWVVYVSTESGNPEAYVTGYPDRRGKWQVSSAGGRGSNDPFWSRDGKQLFYGEANRLMVVDVNTTPGFRVTSPRVHLTLPPGIFAVAEALRDGSGFLVLTLNQDREMIREIEVVVGWHKELLRKMKQ
ncbi:MAG: hypothetical protein OEV30_13585, partial [Ignavibacteria bacterium]|nr:hypothetical protein [Ignavibacteria bacterium]